MTSMNDTGRKDRREARARSLNSVEALLKSKKIKSERVMDFICFKYQGKEHRVQQLLVAKRILNVA